MNFREKTLDSGVKIILGKDEVGNDELMRKFEGKSNVILHTVAPGSPFCVIEAEKPKKEDIHWAGVFCASYSQDWRDNKSDVLLSVFTGKDISKSKGMKPGLWKVKKSKTIKAKKEDILEISRTKTK